MRPFQFVGVTVGLVVLDGCAGNAAMHVPPTGVVIRPSSSMNSPIPLKQPGESVTLTASETGYTDGFSATIITGEHCVNLSPVPGKSNQFTVTRVFGCNAVLVDVMDDVGRTASAHIVTK